MDDEFVTTVNRLPSPLRRNMGIFRKISSLPRILIALENNKIIGVSDASMTDDAFCAHAYTIISRDEKSQIIGVAPVDCDEDDADSTRAEKSGVLALVTLIHVLEEIGGLSTANVSLYCDNQQAVECNKEMSHLCSFVKFTDADYDIDREITQAIRRAVSNISISHIRGHQDKAKDFDYDNASLETRMNIDMDFEAKTFIKTYDKKWAPTRITPFFPASKAALLIHKNVVSKNLDEHIKLHKYGPTMEQRLVSKGVIQESHMPWIQ